MSTILPNTIILELQKTKGREKVWTQARWRGGHLTMEEQG